MHDTLRYIGKEPIHRRWHHNDLSFGLLYAFSENFVLPISHDEVVHGKGSLIGRMPGDRWQRFANLRAYLGFMFTHPGKKLLFMGCEFAQEREWNHDAGLDWHLLSDANHSGAQALVRDLNAIYRALPALHELDCEPQGFEWIDASDHERSVIAYLRRGRDPDSIAVVVCNFTPVPRPNYRVGVPMPGFYAERLNTDSAFYGGSNVGNGGGVMAEPQGWHGRPHSIELDAAAAQHPDPRTERRLMRRSDLGDARAEGAVVHQRRGAACGAARADAIDDAGRAYGRDSPVRSARPGTARA